MSELVIAEGVELALRPGRLGSRFTALLLDLVFEVLLAIALGSLAFNLFWPNSNIDTAHALWIAIAVAVTVGYPMSAETLSTGRSLGKLAAGLRIVRVDGGPERFRHALARALGGLFADLSLPTLVAVVTGQLPPYWLVLVGTPGAVTAVCSQRGQRIGDLLAGTMSVRERNAAQVGALPVLPAPALMHWAQGASVSEVPTGLVIATRQLVSRVYELDRRVAAKLAMELASEMTAYVSPPPPPGTPAYLYLVAVSSERFRRETGAPVMGLSAYGPVSVAYGSPTYTGQPQWPGAAGWGVPPAVRAQRP